jgi:hypothetical protein
MFPSISTNLASRSIELAIVVFDGLDHKIALQTPVQSLDAAKISYMAYCVNLDHTTAKACPLPFYLERQWKALQTPVKVA